MNVEVFQDYDLYFENTNEPWSGASVARILQRAHSAGAGATGDKSKTTSAVRRSERLRGVAQVAPTVPVEPSEADVLSLQSVPTFNDTLSLEDAEAFLCVLTAPALRVPLVLAFFSGHRVGALFNAELRSVVESVLFEPHKFPPAGTDHRAGGRAVAAAECGEAAPTLDALMTGGSEAADDATQQPVAPAFVTMVPARVEDSGLLATEHGSLMTALMMRPDTVVDPLLDLATAAVNVCGGDYRSSFVDLLMFVIRIVARVQDYVDVAQSVPGTSTACKAQAPGCLRRIASFCCDCAGPRVREWIAQADADNHVQRLTVFHAHLVLLVGSRCRANDASAADLQALATSTAFAMSWHAETQPHGFLTVGGRVTPKRTAAQAVQGDSMLLSSVPVPIRAVFRVYHQQRNAIMACVREASAEARGRLLESMLQAALRQPSISARGWAPVPDAPLQCRHVLESQHPYLPGQHLIQTISFPGTSRITVRFDPRSRTEKGGDFVSFFKVRGRALRVYAADNAGTRSTLVRCLTPPPRCAAG